MDGAQAARLRRVVVPRGTYSIEVLPAEHHRRFLRTSIAAKERTTDLGALRLLPFPVARGTVLGAEEKSLAGATVKLPAGEVCGTSNEQGVFECELGDQRIEALVVSREGYGPRELRLERGLDRDVDLGRIVLSSARTLTLKIVRPEGVFARLTLWHDAPDRYEHSKLKDVELKEREEEVRFEVATGKYIALVSGEKSLERLEVPVEVKDEDVTKTITVAPFRLLGNVRFGEELLADGMTEIVSPEHTWRARLTIAGGAFGGQMWQTGKVNAFILQELFDSPELGADPTRWDIHIAKRLIAGRVFDALTKERVPGAQLSLTANTGDSKFYTDIKLKPDGTYELLANRHGTYSLRVTSPEHVAWMAEVVMTDQDKGKTVDVALEHGVLQRLDIVTPAGAPVPNANIFEGIQPDRVNPQFMTHADGNGTFELRGKPGEMRLLYVVPRDGSFAVLRVQIPRRSEDARPMQVVITPGTSSLRIRATRDDKPVAAGVLVRYNGEFIPGAILRFVTRDLPGTKPNGEGVLPRLPAGAYEVWALAGPIEEVALIESGGASRAPARAGLSGGEGVVEVVAPPREVRRRP